MKFISRIARASVPKLVRAACVLSLVALTMMVYSVISPRPLPVILAMSLGHAIGALAFGCYLVAVLIDLSNRRRDSTP